ncbi:MAG TPA: zinc/manganese transporter permease [Alcaligenaceae bacterium]|nr:zinc/manganese transporter permease [Alcaligenaceae bacterium]
MTFSIGDVPLDILVPALCAGLLVIATHVPLGVQVLNRGIIFIDLAIAQVAGLGAYLVTMLWGQDVSTFWMQFGAVLLALVASWLLVATERLSQRYQEPLIGIVFVLSATAVILLLAKDPHGGQHLSDLLAGQILWISQDQILYSTVATAFILVAIGLLHHRRNAFYSVFAIAITVSVQLVGVYLVFATLIIPALSTVLLRNSRVRLGAGYLMAGLSYAIGLLGSAYFDLPTGPLIVWSLALTGLISALVLRMR